MKLGEGLIEVGRQKGIREGREEGRREAMHSIALNMLNHGMDSNFIKRFTGLSFDDIQRNKAKSP